MARSRFSGRVCGSVSWRIDAPNSRGYDLHANQPRTNLIDLYHSNGLSGAGGNYINNPNHLTGLTIWNQKLEGGSISNYNFWNISCNSNYCGTSVVSPIIVGMHGLNNTTFNQSSLKYEESNGTKVFPESLFEAQLDFRFGNNTIWVQNIIDEYNQLKINWYANVLSTDEFIIEEVTTLKLYPNPVKNILSVQGVDAGDELAVFDLLGRLHTIKTSVITNKKTELDVYPLKSGIYFVMSKNKNKALRFIKE